MTAHVALWLWKLICAHQIAVALLLGWTFSAYVTVYVPSPTPSSGRFYIFWYNLMHMVAANIDKLKSKN